MAENNMEVILQNRALLRSATSRPQTKNIRNTLHCIRNNTHMLNDSPSKYYTSYCFLLLTMDM